MIMNPHDSLICEYVTVFTPISNSWDENSWFYSNVSLVFDLYWMHYHTYYKKKGNVSSVLRTINLIKVIHTNLVLARLTLGGLANGGSSNFCWEILLNRFTKHHNIICYQWMVLRLGWHLPAIVWLLQLLIWVRHDIHFKNCNLQRHMEGNHEIICQVCWVFCIKNQDLKVFLNQSKSHDIILNVLQIFCLSCICHHKPYNRKSIRIEVKSEMLFNL